MMNPELDSPLPAIVVGKTGTYTHKEVMIMWCVIGSTYLTWTGDLSGMNRTL